MRLEDELDLHIRARAPLITIISCEEERVIDSLQQLCEERGDRLYLWDHADHFQLLAGNDETLKANDPLTVLEAIEKYPNSAIFLLRDYHQCWQNQPRIIRKLRNLSQSLKYTRKTIIVSTPSETICSAGGCSLSGADSHPKRASTRRAASKCTCARRSCTPSAPRTGAPLAPARRRRSGC